MNFYILILLTCFSSGARSCDLHPHSIVKKEKASMQYSHLTENLIRLEEKEFLAYEKSIIQEDNQYKKKYGIKIYKLESADGKVILESQGHYYLCPSIDFVLLTLTRYEDCFAAKGGIEMTSPKRFRSLLEKEDSFFVFDSLGQRHEIPNISAQEFKRAQKRGLREHKKYFNKYGMNVYETNKGEIIVEANMLYCIYPSFNLFHDVLENPARRSIMASLHSKNPYNQDFPNYVDSLVNSLLNDFGISFKGRDEKEVIADVDKIINEKRTISFFDQHFLSFVALVGSSILNHYKGNWQMTLADDMETWTPYLVVGKQKIYFVDHIKEDLFNLHQKKPLTEVFETMEAIINASGN